MLNSIRYSILRTAKKTPVHHSSSLAFQSRQGFLNFFKKDSSDKNLLDKDESHDLNAFQKMSYAFKENFSETTETEYEKEKKSVFEEARVKEQVGQTCFSLGQYQKALEQFRGTFNLIKSYCEEDDSRLAYYLQKIGDVYYEVKEWDQAINHYEESLEILIEGLGRDHEKVARCYFLIGMCYAKQKNYGQSIENLKKSLKIYNRSSNKNQNLIASCYSMLAENYLYFGKHKEALHYLDGLLSLFREMYKNEKIKEEEDPLMNQYYLNFGWSMANATHDHTTALQYMYNYLKGQIKINGEKSLGTAGVYLKIGQVKAMEGSYTEASQCYQKALEVTTKAAGQQHRQIGSCYNAIGSALLAQEDYEAALTNLRKALKYFEDETNLEVPNCYKNIGLAFQAQGDQTRAVENFKRCVEKRASFFEGFEEVDVESGLLHTSMASIYFEKGDYRQGVEEYGKLMEVMAQFCAEESRLALES